MKKGQKTNTILSSIKEAEKAFEEKHGLKPNLLIFNPTGFGLYVEESGRDPLENIATHDKMFISICMSSHFPFFRVGFSEHVYA